MTFTIPSKTIFLLNFSYRILCICIYSFDIIVNTLYTFIILFFLHLALHDKHSSMFVK